MTARSGAHRHGRLPPGALAVTRHLLVHGPSSRRRLGAELRLSEASMSRLARTLKARGFVAENSDATRTLGRPRQILSAVPDALHIVGVKLTADAAYGAACDLFGTVLTTSRSALPRRVNGKVPAEATIRTITTLVNRLRQRVPSLDGVCVSIGGVVAPGRTTVQEGTFLGWHDVELALPLESALGVPVVLSNDVTALAREQLWFGAGRTHSSFGLITVGSGLGLGVVREGKVLEQLIDNGHLLQHAPIDPTGPTCTHGHHGCVAAYLNRDDIERRLARNLGRPITASAAIRDARFAGASWLVDAATALGHLVATLAGALQTERIVLAGEDVAPLTEVPAFWATIEDRIRPGPHETQHCALDLSIAPLTFTDWAHGAAVVGIQHVLGDLTP